MQGGDLSIKKFSLLIAANQLAQDGAKQFEGATGIKTNADAIYVLLKQDFAGGVAGPEIDIGNGAVGKTENQASATIRVEGFGKATLG